VLLITLIDLFTFSHGSNQKNKGSMLLWCGLQRLDVATWYFEEICQHLKKN